MDLNSDQNGDQKPAGLPARFIYLFGNGQADGRKTDKNLLGGKGANLAEMTVQGLPVPPGFTITTEICTLFHKSAGKLPDGFRKQVLGALKKVEAGVQKIFGDPERPLLLSVRSGSRASMPGMMDTILNLGLNDETVVGLGAASQNPRFAWDSYRRLIQMYGDVVMGVNGSLLHVVMEDLKSEKGYIQDSQLTATDLEFLCKKLKKLILEQSGQAFPQNPEEQLWGAIFAVFESWHNPRAKTYRALHDIPESWGTAVNVQSMVFGNLGETSGTGVAFTRNPSTGEKAFFGEFLMNAQGEDVVAGIRTPLPIAELSSLMPQAFSQLESIYQKLESHYRDMQDIEFTIQEGRLWMLQTRSGKRTAQAALKIAIDLVDEGVISEQEALMRIDPKSLDQLLHPTLNADSKRTTIARGLPASPGAVSGQVVFTSEQAEEAKKANRAVVLVRLETSPEDIAGMVAAVGILTARGGMTSHAAVVARGMGKCCVAGCQELEIDSAQEVIRTRGFVVKAGEVITLDGSTGEVFLGLVETKEPELDGYFERIMLLSDRYRRLGVRANADTPKDAMVAQKFGAQGIGLCRTEHMFFDPTRIDVVRMMILAENELDRRAALSKLLPMQREDFIGLFKAMVGQPVTIRLLDPPLHEFLPHTDAECRELASRLKIDFAQLRAKVDQLHEFNPMLGHRGCRLAMTFPEIYEMQAQAIAEATVIADERGLNPCPEIMIPLVGYEKELSVLRAKVERIVHEVYRKAGQAGLPCLIGTMIELPRAAIVAHEIARHADFFSFGTNDLTQTTLGLSRDDAGRFMGAYLGHGVFEKDPFVTIDQTGVGPLVRMGVQNGRKAKTNLKIGVCGEHGGDPASIEYFQKAGLDYVSCSPFRVPIARLAAAQAAIKEETKV